MSWSCECGNDNADWDDRCLFCDSARPADEPPQVSDEVPPGGGGAGDGVEPARAAETTSTAREAGPGPAPLEEAATEQVCLHEGNGPGREICKHCGEPITPAAASPSTETAAVEEAPGQPASNPGGAAEADQAFELVFPWGRHRLCAGEVVELGRGVGPYQDQLAPRGGVSRRHAELEVVGHRLFVTDRNSTNKTWVNGIACDPDRRYAVQAGSQVGLGREFTFQIRAVS